MNAFKKIAIIVAPLSALFSFAHAAPYTINWTAQLTTNLGTLVTGTSISGSFGIDTSLAPSGLSLDGVFYDLPGTNATFGGSSASGDAGVQMYNNSLFYNGDLADVGFFEASFTLGGVSGLNPDFIFYSGYNNYSLFNSNSLSELTTTDFSTAAQNELRFYDNTGNVAAASLVTSWSASPAGVPDESSTSCLLGLSALGFAVAGARRLLGKLA